MAAANVPSAGDRGPGPGSLTDEHILDLSERITSRRELMTLGIKVLRQRDFKIKSAITNAREIQDAAYDVLSAWFQQQENRREAYISLDTGLRESGMNQLAGELKQWVQKTSTQVTTTPDEQFTTLQKGLKQSLHRTWKNALKHDWIPERVAKTLPLLEFYTGLRWKKMVKALVNYKIEMTSIYDIFNVVDREAEPEPKSIFIEAEPGMGKTSSLALVALEWAKDSSTPKVPFHLVFLIRLKYVKSGQSLVDIIRKQHGGLKRVTDEYIESILEGDTKHRVLLMLDGYDEYKPGTNDDIDSAIELTIGNCFLILTSRPGDYLSKSIRDQMDGEIVIEGFSNKNIEQCSIKYLDSKEKSKEMLEQAKMTGLYALLHIPIILVMTVVVFVEKKSLPKTKTEIYKTIFQLVIDRTTLKTFGCKSADIAKLEDLLYRLGEFSWNALQDDFQQLLLKKDELEAKDPDLLKLGLLYEVGVDAATVQEPETLLSFQHKSLQDFAGSKHLAKRLDNIMEEGQDVKKVLKELFPCWEVVNRHREVVVFTAGLMKDSRPLVQYIYEMQIENYLHRMRTSRSPPSIDSDLFRSLQTESTVRLFDHPLHNKYINYYHSYRDTNPVYCPSRVYHFDRMRQGVVLKDHLTEAEEIPPCAMYIWKPDEAVTKRLISTCSRISKRQEVTDLELRHVIVTCDDCTSTLEAPRLKNPVALFLYLSDLPDSFYRKLLRQLLHCGESLEKLDLWEMNLEPFESLLDELLEDLVAHHEAGLAQTKLVLALEGYSLSEEFVEKWRNRCEKVDSIDCKILDPKAKD